MKLTRHTIIRSGTDNPCESTDEFNFNDITDMKFMKYQDVESGEERLVITLQVNVSEFDHETNKILENLRTIYLDSRGTFESNTKMFNDNLIVEKYDLTVIDDNGEVVMEFDRPTVPELFMVYHYLEVERTLHSC